MSTMTSTTVGTSWSLGTLIAFPISALLTLILLAIGLFALGVVIHARRKGALEPDGAIGIAAGFLTAALVFGGGTAAAMYPWKAEYHQWRPVAAEVQEIQARLISSGDGMEERFVVRLDGQQYRCDDSRCALVEEGDVLELLCKRDFEYASTDGYSCRFIRHEPAA